MTTLRKSKQLVDGRDVERTEPLDSAADHDLLIEHINYLPAAL
jgi:hypothetical protein